jgi:hypothetical protein
MRSHFPIIYQLGLSFHAGLVMGIAKVMMLPVEFIAVSTRATLAIARPEALSILPRLIGDCRAG